MPNRHLPVQSQEWKHQNNVIDVAVVSLWLPFSQRPDVSIADFEQVNTD